MLRLDHVVQLWPISEVGRLEASILPLILLGIVPISLKTAGNLLHLLLQLLDAADLLEHAVALRHRLAGDYIGIRLGTDYGVYLRIISPHLHQVLGEYVGRALMQQRYGRRRRHLGLGVKPVCSCWQ